MAISLNLTNVMLLAIIGAKLKANNMKLITTIIYGAIINIPLSILNFIYLEMILSTNNNEALGFMAQIKFIFDQSIGIIININLVLIGYFIAGPLAKIKCLLCLEQKKKHWNRQTIY